MTAADFEQLWRDTVAGKPGLSYACLRTACQLVSYPYGWAVGLRNLSYDRHLFAQHRVGILVISIGNLTVGGTGKTPLLLKLAEELAARGPLAILSRGYRSPAETQKEPLWLSLGRGPELPVELVGDEAYLVASRLPQAYVLVGRHKVQAAEQAVEAGCRLILVDDGFQHRQLARDCDIVLVDAEQPFGNGSLFPRGQLREPPTALKRADLIVVSNLPSPDTFPEIAERLSSYSSAPLVGVQTKMRGIRALSGDFLPTPPAAVGLFCGIARPERFAETVRAAGIDVVDQLALPDHLLCPMERLQQFAQSCKDKGAHGLLCTEKDAVKLPANLYLALPVACVIIGIEIVAGESAWRELLNAF